MLEDILKALLELNNSINRLNETLNSGSLPAPAASKRAPSAKSEAPSSEPAPAVGAADSEPSLDLVRAALTAIPPDSARSILLDYDVTKISQLHPEAYTQVIEKASKEVSRAAA